MKAAVGDRVVVASAQPGGRPRSGTIVELRHPDGTPPYVVCWSDTGQDVVYFPGSDSRVEHVGPAEAAAAPRGGDAPRVKSWRVDVTLVEDGTETTARAVLHDDTDLTIESPHGRTMRAPTDPDDPEVGDQVAVARALRHLSDRLLGAAGTTMSDHEQRDVILTH
jgi:hypothetical protein